MIRQATNLEDSLYFGQDTTYRMPNYFKGGAFEKYFYINSFT